MTTDPGRFFPVLRWKGIRHERGGLIGFGLCCLVALGAVPAPGVDDAALGGLLLWTLLVGLPVGSFEAVTPVIMTVLALGGYVLARAWVAAWQQPTIAGAQWDALWPWLSLLLFPLVARVTAGDRRRVLTLLVLAFVGLCAGMAYKTDPSSVVAAFNNRGARTGFGLNPLLAALFLGVALIGWIVFAASLIGPGRLWVARTLGWLAVVAVLMEMLFLTQSRTALYALAVLLPIYAIVRLMTTRHPPARRRAVLLLLGLVVCAGVFAGLNRDALVHRFERAQTTFKTMHGVHLGEIRQTSTGKRMVLYSFGLRTWWQRPIWGWGPGMEASTMRSSAPHDVDTGAPFPDLLDGYLEVLVRLGAIGLGLSLVLAGVLIRGLVRAARFGRVPQDVGIFLVLTSVYAALFSVTVFELTYAAERLFTVLLLGLIAGYGVRGDPHTDVSA